MFANSGLIIDHGWTSTHLLNLNACQLSMHSSVYCYHNHHIFHINTTQHNRRDTERNGLKRCILTIVVFLHFKEPFINIAKTPFKCIGNYKNKFRLQYKHMCCDKETRSQRKINIKRNNHNHQK